MSLLPEQIANGWAPILDTNGRIVRDASGYVPAPTDAPLPSDIDAAAWRDVLLGDLERQRATIYEPRRYHAGDQPLRGATEKYRDAFQSLFGFSPPTENWCRMVINASSERLRVAGVRMGDDTKDSDEQAWSLWQRSYLDADSTIAHNDAMVCASAFLLAAPDPSRRGRARITVEDPGCTVVRTAPGNRRERLAGLKHYRETDGRQVAWVYLPRIVVAFERRDDTGVWAEVAGTRASNPLGVVPIIPMICAPDSTGNGTSDLLEVIPTQDRINKLGLDEIIASEFASFSQKVVMGWDPPPGAELVASQSRVWAFSNSDVKIAEFAPTQLGATLDALAREIQSLSARTRTPPHYLLGQIVNASGDALKASETGLVAKVRERQRWFGEAWEEALRLGLLLEGRNADDAHRAEIVWADPESRSEAELWDAAVKMRAVGLPYEYIWERCGLSPQQIERFTRLVGLPAEPPAGATTPSATPGTDGTAVPPADTPAA